MRSFRTILIFIFTTAFLLSSRNTIIRADVFVNGSIQTDNRFYLDNGNIDYNQNTFSLKFEYGSDNYHLFANPELKLTGVPDIDELSCLQSSENIFPKSLYLNEAYLDIYEFIIQNLDVRIGKQIIVWGKADKINPTSNICPDDFSDIFRFGEKLGVNSLLLNLYISDFTLNMVYVPVFTPSLLPGGGIAEMAGISLGKNNYIQEPQNTIGKSSQLGVKFNWFIFNYDFSLSYYYGRSTLPVIYKVDYSSTGSIDSTHSKFPKLQVIGFDFSGSLFNMGLWGEAGLFIPEEVITSLYIDKTKISEEKTIKNKAYLRYIAGTDYTFTNGLYYNLQFVHGFDTEMGKDNLNDYLIGRIEKSFLNDKIKILPVTLILTTNDWDNIGENYGICYIPEIQYFPYDNLELDLGVSILGGKGNNILSNQKENDELFIKAKVSF